MKKIIKEVQDNVGAIFKHWQNNVGAKFKKGQDNTKAIFEQGQDNAGAILRKDIIIRNMVIVNRNTRVSKLIREFSKDRDWKDCSLTNFTEWLINKKR